MRTLAGVLVVFAIAAPYASGQERDPSGDAEPEPAAEPGPEAEPEPEAELEGESAGDAPLETIVVAASRGRRVDLDVPRAVAVRSQEDLAKRPNRHFSDLLHGIPGVHAQATGPGQGSPMVRGLTGYHVLTLIDGVRLNGSFFRSGPNQYNALIDPLIVDRVEVVRGPGSVLYGSDALGGVISVRTRDPLAPKDLEPGEFWVRPGGTVQVSQPLRRGGEQNRSTRLEVMAGRGGAAALVGFDYTHYGDREGGRHARTLRNTAYAQVNGDAKVVYDVTPQERISVAFQRTEQRNAPRTHSTTESESFRGTSVGSNQRRDLDQSRQLTYVKLESKDRGVFDRIEATASLQRHYEIQQRVRGGGGYTRSGFEIWSAGFSVVGESDLPLPVDTTLVFGSDYSHDFVDSFEIDRGLRRPRGPIADDADYDLFGVFTQAESNLAKWLDVMIGLRYSLAHVTARDVDPDPSDAFDFDRLDETYDAFVANTGMTLHLGEWVSLVGSVAQGFRAPNLDDTTSFRAVSTNAFDSPSPDLDPERSLTLEIGLKWSLPWMRGQVFYAYTFLDDLIQRVPTGAQVSGLDEFTKENVAEGSIQAIDGEVEIFLSPLAQALGIDAPDLGLSVGARFSWTRGFADALINGSRHKDHLRRTPPASFAALLRYTEPRERWIWAEIEAEFVRRQTRLSRGDVSDTERIPPGGTPGYDLWHVRVGASFFDGRVKGSLGLENVFDRDYRVHGSGTNGPGRALTVSLEALW